MLELINESNSHIFDVLAQNYEDEFSPTSGKKKNQDGKDFIDVVGKNIVKIDYANIAKFLKIQNEIDLGWGH